MVAIFDRVIEINERAMIYVEPIHLTACKMSGMMCMEKNLHGKKLMRFYGIVSFMTD